MSPLVPKQIIIEVTNRCNLSCRFCPLVESEYPIGDMSLDFFKSIVDRIDFPTVVVPWMNGEPLLHPKYYEMIKYLVDKDLPCYITTNGHFYNKELFDLITEENSCYQIIVSLDGVFDPYSRSIELARPGSNRGKVGENIYKFLRLKKRKGNNIDLAVKLCHRGQDFEEIERYIQFWLNQEIDYVCVGKTLIGEVPVGMRIHLCQYSHNNFMVIRWDGKLVACVYNDEMTNKNAFPLGEVDFSTPLLDIYNNSAYKTLREGHSIGVFPPPCNICGFAYTGAGMSGTIKFRNPLFQSQTIFYKRDYYNEFFSLTDKSKENNYYGSRGSMEEKVIFSRHTT